MTTTPCILCRNEGFAPVCTKNGYDIVRCTTCGLVRVHPLPTPEQLAAYYKEGYNQFRYSFASPLGDPPVRKQRELRILERFQAPGKLLDVGSAYGHFLDNAHRHGWDTTGVEPQDEARIICQSRFRLPVLEHLDAVPAHAFDAATLWHVIEHLAAPVDFLSAVRSKLHDGGILALATPNIDSLVARATGESWGWLSPPDHLFLYSPRTLPRLLEAAGFEVLHVETRRGAGRNTLLLMMQAVAYRLGLFARIRSSVARASHTYHTARTVSGRVNVFVIAERITNFLSLLLTPALIALWKFGLGDEVLAVARNRTAGDHHE